MSEAHLIIDEKQYDADLAHYYRGHIVPGTEQLFKRFSSTAAHKPVMQLQSHLHHACPRLMVHYRTSPQ